jgi:cbb3-type cytochrome oxidase subunit 3
MYKNVLQGIENIAIWPVISFVIFFLFFIGLLWYVYTADKDYINRMKKIPMDDTTPIEKNTHLNSTLR